VVHVRQVHACLLSGMTTHPETCSSHELPGTVDEDKLRKQLSELQEEDLSSMVEDVTYPNTEDTITCKMLYLTNKRAVRFHIQDMMKIRRALQLQEHRLVIRLLPSCFGRVWWTAFPNWEGRFPQKGFPELDENKAVEVELQLLLFVQEVLLPLAVECHALVIGTESCSFTAAFLQASASVQRAMGRRCPFSVLLFSDAFWINKTAEDKNSNACAFRKTSEQWESANNDRKFDKALTKRFGNDTAYWPQQDISVGASHCVMFECLDDDDKIHTKVSDQFQNDFISSLQQEIPVLALQTYGEDRMDKLQAVAEHVKRGMQLVLLDSRNRKGRSIDVSTEKWKEVVENELK